jgi:hypothetical protein
MMQSERQICTDSTHSHCLTQLIVLCVLPSPLLCAVLPTTVSAVIGNEERGSEAREGPCGTACCNRLGPDSPSGRAKFGSGRNSALRCVSGPWPSAVCASDVRRRLFLPMVFAREAGGRCGKGIVSHLSELL